MSRELLIAVIDDDESFRTALVDCLGSLGYGARGFASADEFIGAAADGACDCVITDIHMPGMSGFDLGQLLAARRCGLPVIMITARSGRLRFARSRRGWNCCWMVFCMGMVGLGSDWGVFGG